jgi:long-chain acyl-CoA synthetase
MAAGMMDLRDLVGRMSADTRHNEIIAFENGQTVRRRFAAVAETVKATRDRLAAWGVKPGMRVGIRAPNCYQWIVHDIAAIELRAQTVAFTDDFASANPRELCDRYDLALLLVAAGEKVRGELPEFVAPLDGEKGDVRAIARAPSSGDPEFERPGLIFSSGSAGGLKGLMLNRRGIEGSVDAFTQAVAPRRDDRLLLFLPLSNFQQRLMYYSAFWYGFDLAVTEPAHLFRGLQDLSPTILVAPPALYEAFETRFDNLPWAKRTAAKLLGRLAQAMPVRPWREKLGRAIFRQAHEALGGRMRFMVTGMAPIKRTTLDLFALMQLPLFETYGLVESGSVSLNLPHASKRGTVGRPLPGVSVSFRPDGEILVRRRHSMTSCYFECADGENERTFVGDAVATGDIGRIDEDGYLYLVGRKKEIIITSGGEKVHPEVIEAAINACPDVLRAVVLARDSAPSLAALVVPKVPGDAAARDRIERFIDELKGQKASIGKIVFTDVPFSRENGFLRPNLKLDRRQIAGHFRSEIEERHDDRAALVQGADGG